MLRVQCPAKVAGPVIAGSFQKLLCRQYAIYHGRSGLRNVDVLHIGSKARTIRALERTESSRMTEPLYIREFTRSGRYHTTNFTATVVHTDGGYVLKKLEYHGFPHRDEVNMSSFDTIDEAFDNAFELARAEIDG